jgi:hypothetical protein
MKFPPYCAFVVRSFVAMLLTHYRRLELGCRERLGADTGGLSKCAKNTGHYQRGDLPAGSICGGSGAGQEVPVLREVSVVTVALVPVRLIVSGLLTPLRLTVSVADSFVPDAWLGVNFKMIEQSDPLLTTRPLKHVPKPCWKVRRICSRDGVRGRAQSKTSCPRTNRNVRR